MRPFVLDCSMTMSWIFPEDATERTSAIRDSLAEAFAIVPALWSLEVGNVLCQAARRGKIAQADWIRVQEDLACLPIEVDSGTPGLVRDQILPLACRWGLSVYDASYLELALRFALPLATLSKELTRACHSAGVSVL